MPARQRPTPPPRDRCWRRGTGASRRAERHPAEGVAARQHLLDDRLAGREIEEHLIPDRHRVHDAAAAETQLLGRIAGNSPSAARTMKVWLWARMTRPGCDPLSTWPGSGRPRRPRRGSRPSGCGPWEAGPSSNRTAAALRTPDRQKTTMSPPRSSSPMRSASSPNGMCRAPAMRAISSSNGSRTSTRVHAAIRTARSAGAISGSGSTASAPEQNAS